MIRVCDLMHKGVLYCYPDDSAQVIADMMATNRIRSVAVVDESGEVWGSVSMLDLLQLYGKKLDKTQAQEIMRPYRIEVDPQWPIEKAIELMKKHRIEHLLIIDPHAGPKRPVGILTDFDIVRYMSHVELGVYEQMLKVPSD
ncbi:MAG TPA: CBS domain-containing protein [Syntrophorhabdales bacterium]|nr:CBS domain-containing protein [Syntrophorhabdales bacterium]